MSVCWKTPQIVVFFFEYAPEFIKTGIELSPFKLPLRSGVFEDEKRTFEGLFGLFNDSLPDGWGILLLDRKLKKAGLSIEQITPLQRLSAVGKHGMGALEYEPETDEPLTKPDGLVLDMLAKEAEQIYLGYDSFELDRLLALNGSSGGARPKMLALVSDDKKTIIPDGENRARFWVPLLGLFTGARCNELCQLLPSDIHQTEGVWVISINDEGDKHVKTKAGIREIPVHPELIKMGFWDYVRQMRREKRLFPELKPNARGAYSDEMSRWFGRFLETVNRTLKAKDRMGQGHVFHSFRHTFRTELRNNDASNEHVLRLGGWERGSSLADHYGTISIKVLEKTMVEKVRYDGLDLSHLYA